MTCPQHPHPSPLCLVQEVEGAHRRGDRVVGYLPAPVSQARPRRRAIFGLWPETLAFLVVVAACIAACVWLATR